MEEALKSFKGQPVYLLTTIPRFYEPLGFKKADKIPPALEKNNDWCRLRPEKVYGYVPFSLNENDPEAN